jgi:hypothetical protein|tara:strand:- start:123 stop:455 length:333 start_codon:yes stop_codon:yes gene_type:complete
MATRAIKTSRCKYCYAETIKEGRVNRVPARYEVKSQENGELTIVDGYLCGICADAMDACLDGNSKKYKEFDDYLSDKGLFVPEDDPAVHLWAISCPRHIETKLLRKAAEV